MKKKQHFNRRKKQKRIQEHKTCEDRVLFLVLLLEIGLVEKIRLEQHKSNKTTMMSLFKSKKPGKEKRKEYQGSRLLSLMFAHGNVGLFFFIQNCITANLSTERDKKGEKNQSSKV
jgi:hypothetical protein